MDMLDRRVRFRHLQCFLTTAEFRNVGKAAEALALSQPAVSKAIGELEEILSAQLFDRHPSGMSLTKLGTIFLQHASVSMASLRQGLDHIRAARRDGSAGLTIGVMPNVAPLVMPLAIADFRLNFPDAIIQVMNGGSLRILDLLRHGEIDLVVGRLSQAEYMNELAFEHLYSESLSFVARSGHALAAKSNLPAKCLEAYDLILPDADTNVGQLAARFLMARGVRLSAGTIYTTFGEFARGYVLNSDALWMVPRGAVRSDLDNGTLAELAIETANLEGPVGITTRAGVPQTLSMTGLIASVRAISASLYPTMAGTSAAAKTPV